MYLFARDIEGGDRRFLGANFRNDLERVGVYGKTREVDVGEGVFLRESLGELLSLLLVEVVETFFLLVLVESDRHRVPILRASFPRNNIDSRAFPC